MPEVVKIPDTVEYRELTLNQLRSTALQCTVTHMAIAGDIPPHHEIAPSLQQLQIKHLHRRDKLERQVKFWASKK